MMIKIKLQASRDLPRAMLWADQGVQLQASTGFPKWILWMFRCTSKWIRIFREPRASPQTFEFHFLNHHHLQQFHAVLSHPPP